VIKKNPAIQLNAAFLLIVFSLNMIIGFVCATGMDRLFISHHLEKTKLTAHEGFRQGDEAVTHHKTEGCKDNCCNEHVVKFAKVDKSVPQCFEGLHAIFFTALISSFFNINVLPTSKALAQNKYFVRSHHPPISDIRIAIQSFQI